MIIDMTKPLPDDKVFFSLVDAFVFRCPAATVVSKKKVKVKVFENICARDCSFRTKGITGTLLNTITAQIKKIVKPGLYHRIEKGEKVELIFDASSSSEKIVFRENSQMLDAEAVFYYIRNAYARGDLEIIPGKDRIYKLKSTKRGDVKAQMILKEQTLQRLAVLSGNNKIQNREDAKEKEIDYRTRTKPDCSKKIGKYHG